MNSCWKQQIPESLSDSCNNNIYSVRPACLESRKNNQSPGPAAMGDRMGFWTEFKTSSGNNNSIIIARSYLRKRHARVVFRWQQRRQRKQERESGAQRSPQKQTTAPAVDTFVRAPVFSSDLSFAYQRRVCVCV